MFVKELIQHVLAHVDYYVNDMTQHPQALPGSPQHDVDVVSAWADLIKEIEFEHQLLGRGSTCVGVGIRRGARVLALLSMRQHYHTGCEPGPWLRQVADLIEQAPGQLPGPHARIMLGFIAAGQRASLDGDIKYARDQQWAEAILRMLWMTYHGFPPPGGVIKPVSES